MYHYASCGLPNVYLKDGYKIKKTPHGDAVSIVNVEGLHQAMARVIVASKSPLTCDEFRFLRKEMELTQQDLADIFGVSEPTIRNWEAGRGENGISKLADSCLRHLYREYMHGDNVIARSIKDIATLEREHHALTLRMVNNVWQADESFPECA